jgi:hypothetical protein
MNAWLDNQNLYGDDKRWVVRFAPRVLTAPSKRKRLLELFPDGRTISVVRDPVTWFASARVWSNWNEWAVASAAMEEWIESTEAILQRYEEAPDTTAIVTFEDLVKGTAKTMRRLCRFLGLRWREELAVPTFNCLPIRPNSSFPAQRARVVQEPLERARAISTEDRAFIEAKARPLYDRVATVARAGRGDGT